MKAWRTAVGMIAVALALAACGGAGDTGQSVTALLDAGLKAQAAGDTATAAADYKKVLTQDPRNKYALYNLGLIAQLGGDPQGAERYYREALDVDPRFGSALFNLAIVLTPTDKPGAEELYRRALDVQPGWAEAHLNLGFVLIQEGRAAEGRAELAQAVRLEPALAARIPKSLLPGGTAAVTPSP